MKRPLIWPTAFRSIFSKVSYPQGDPVRIYFWNVRIGTERAGHVAIQVGDDYYSFWADSSPNARAAGNNAGMFIVRSLEQDQLITGRRIQLYQQSPSNPSDPNAIELPDVPTTLRGIAQDERLHDQLKSFGAPSQVLSLHSLDTAKMKAYLERVVSQHATYHWDKKGRSKQGFNCATFLEAALYRGGIKRLVPTYSHTLRRIGVAVSIIVLPILLWVIDDKAEWNDKNTKLGVAASALIGGAMGGVMDAQPALAAAFTVMNANRSDVPCRRLTEATIWFFGSLLSCACSGFGYDNLIGRQFISPGQIYTLVQTAHVVEQSQRTMGEPRQVSDHAVVPTAC